MPIYKVKAQIHEFKDTYGYKRARARAQRHLSYIDNGNIEIRMKVTKYEQSKAARGKASFAYRYCIANVNKS